MPTSVTYSGWGGGSWGQTSWGTTLEAIVPDGVQSTALVGAVSIGLGADVSASGVFSTTQIGSVVVLFGKTVFPTGIESQGLVGSSVIKIDKIVYPLGTQGVGETTKANVWGLVSDVQVPSWEQIVT